MATIRLRRYDQMSMPTVRELHATLDRIIPPSGAAGWDVTGLQLGDPDVRVSTFGVCHEVTEAVVSRLEADPVDLLLTYHPLLFRPTTAIVNGSGPTGRAFRLLRAGVALTVAHTSFDVASGGTADSLASALGLTDVVGFGPAEAPDQVKLVTFAPPDAVEQIARALGDVGAGRIGDYSACSFRVEGTGTFLPGDASEPVVGVKGRLNQETEVRLEMIAPASRRDAMIATLVAVHPYEEPAFDVYGVVSNTGFIGRIGASASGSLGALASEVADALGGDGLRVSGRRDMPVRRVAVVPGSGGDFVGAARAVGADVIVTGDVSHHRVVGALDLGMAVIDPGHVPTERPGMSGLVARVRTACGDSVAVVDLTDADPTPWR